jgi:two-component system, chemotaxis family, chemotaxis protein CheY
MTKILIVDDSAMSRRIVRSILDSAGFEVVEAADGLLAIEQYFLEKPDVVILDLVMSGMYGLDVLSKLREMDPTAAVVIATADIQGSTRQMAHDAGAFALITKPFVAAELVEAVNAAMKERPNAADR